jgi:hypothetical protein
VIDTTRASGMPDRDRAIAILTATKSLNVWITGQRQRELSHPCPRT